MINSVLILIFIVFSYHDGSLIEKINVVTAKVTATVLTNTRLRMMIVMAVAPFKVKKPQVLACGCGLQGKSCFYSTSFSLSFFGARLATNSALRSAYQSGSYFQFTWNPLTSMPLSLIGLMYIP